MLKSGNPVVFGQSTKYAQLYTILGGLSFGRNSKGHLPQSHIMRIQIKILRKTELAVIMSRIVRATVAQSLTKDEWCRVVQ